MRERLAALPLLIRHFPCMHVKRGVSARAALLGERAGVEDEDGVDNLPVTRR